MSETKVKIPLPLPVDGSRVRFWLFIRDKECEGIGILRIEATNEAGFYFADIRIETGLEGAQTGNMGITEITLTQRHVDLLCLSPPESAYEYICCEPERVDQDY
jgi:hypothetical protein